MHIFSLFLPHDTCEFEAAHVKELESIHSHCADPLSLSGSRTNYPPSLTIKWIYDHVSVNVEVFFGATEIVYQHTESYSALFSTLLCKIHLAPYELSVSKFCPVLYPPNV